MASPSTTAMTSYTSAPTTALNNRIPKLEPRKRRSKPVNSRPVPPTPPLPPPPDTSGNWSFIIPARRVLSPGDHQIFSSSPTYKLICAWIFGLADAVVDTPCSAIKSETPSRAVATILALLDEAHALVAQCPPDHQGGSRFGNKAFRRFLHLVRQKSAAWHASLGLTSSNAMAEVSSYLLDSFGNYNRIDYGSGHELNFAMWLLCLYQLGIISSADFRALVLGVFDRYLALMRHIQMTYYLEPAGSHGVWGLDDYQFLPFLFGASQLLHHSFITPRAIHQDLTLEESAHDYLYLSQVAFVNSTKTVKGLRWHSPMLDDISSAKSWVKIDAGMRRMFISEVLGKLPVMQHFLFASLIPATPDMSQEHSATYHEFDDPFSHVNNHSHDVIGWSDCCGIKVPSSIAAAQEMKKGAVGSALRRIPFD